MKVVVVHNRYRERGGEDAVAGAEAALLREAGHAVIEYQRHNDELDAMPAPSAALQACWSRRTLRELGALLQAERPEVVHLHNSWPLISPSVCAAAAAARVPLVATLHNYRLACAQGSFVRDGRVCTDCLGHAPWPALRHACYRASRAQTAVLAASMLLHRGLGTWQRGVAQWIALSGFARERYVEMGLPGERIAVLTNFAEDPGSDVAKASATPGRSGLLYVGRLSPEKGSAVLAEALRRAPEVPIDLIGDGPDAALFDGLPNVRRHGALAPAAVRAAMRRAALLVVPSLALECSPRVVAEAMACGLPVLASASGALAELVHQGRTGWLVPPGDVAAWAEALRRAAARPEAELQPMRQQARAFFDVEASPAVHLQRLLAIYAAARARMSTPV